jgi:O-methyltransferase
MDNHVIFEIARENRSMSDVERLVNLYWGLSSVLTAGVPGDVVEIGCNRGQTSVFLRMVMNHFDPARELHVFDSFEGLPAPGLEDRRSCGCMLMQGQCKAAREEVLETFARWDLRPPLIHAGWFSETLERDLPGTIAFAYLDADFYGSTRLGLECVYPRMAPAAVAVLDDYADRTRNPRAWDGLPGPKRACDDFFSDKPERVCVLVGTGQLAFGYFRRGRVPAQD